MNTAVPTFDANNVYVPMLHLSSVLANVWALNKTTGALVWGPTAMVNEVTNGAAVVTNGRVYVNGANNITLTGSIYEINAATGAIIKQTAIPGSAGPAYTLHSLCRYKDGIVSKGLYQDLFFFGITDHVTLTAGPTLTSPVDGDTTNSQTPTFSWQSLGTGVTYDIQLDDDPAFGSVNYSASAIATNSWTPGSNIAQGTWYWHVRGVNLAGNGPYCAAWDVTVDITPPAVPVLVAPAQDTSQANLPLFDWGAVADARQFNLAVYDAGHAAVPGFPVNIVQGPGEDKSSYQLTLDAALADGKYTWAVEAIDYATNTSGYSAENWFAVDKTAPAVPVLSAPAEDTSQVDLPLFDWGAIADARQFNLALYDAGHVAVPGFPVNIVQGPGEDKSSYQLILDAALADGRYTWAVEAIDYATNTSGYSAEDWFAVDKTAPAVPVLVAPVGGAVVETPLPLFDWQPVADAREFTLELYDAADGLVLTKAIVQAEGEDKSEYQLVAGEELAQGGYTWQVQARDYALNASAFCAPEGFEVQLVPAWPAGWKEVKSVPGTAAVKDGGWLTTAEPETDGLPVIYAAKGNKSAEFLKYYAAEDSWSSLAPIRADEGGREKLPKKGCVGVSDGQDYIYMTKGNNTTGFWKYSIGGDSWTRLPDVPLGPANKKVKGGTDLAYVGGVTDEESSYVYLMKGYKTEFYRFNTQSNRWDTLANVPYGIAPKYGPGSFLVYDGSGYLYAHQAKYTDPAKTKHFLFRYDLAGQKWDDTLDGMPVLGMDGGKMKNKKSKDGGSGAWYDGSMYALKGGNTCQFYRYAPAPADSWTELDTMKSFGSTAKKKKVKAGGDLVSFGFGSFFAFKGNKTFEFWRYFETALEASNHGPQARSGAMSEGSAIGDRRMAVAPNPIADGLATLRFSLPKAGSVYVSVYDALGRAVLRQAYSVQRKASSVSLDVRSLSAGVYLVRFDADGCTASQKLVVER